MKKIGAIFIVGMAGALHAADVKVGGTVFAHYEYFLTSRRADGTAAKSYNAFDLTRAQAQVGAKLDDRYDVFVQWEANLASRDNTANQAYLKQAFLKARLPGEASAKFGFVPSVWRSVEEGVWKHRYVAKTLEDEEGVLYATDRGLSAEGAWNVFSAAASVTNGEGVGARGTSGNEPSKHKDYAARLSASAPGHPGLKVHVYVHEGARMAGWPRDRRFGALSWEGKSGHLWAGGYRAVSGVGVATGTGTITAEGWSVHGSWSPTARDTLLLRLDRWDPDADVSRDDRVRWLAAWSRTVAVGVRVSLDFQQTRPRVTTSIRRRQSVASTHLEVKF